MSRSGRRQPVLICRCGSGWLPASGRSCRGRRLLLAFAFDLVSDLAGFHHFIDLLFDEVGAVGDVFDDLQVAGRKGGSLIGREEVFHLVDVVDQGSLVSGGGRDDVVHRQVTEYASFDLDFLRIGFPFDFVTASSSLRVMTPVDSNIRMLLSFR